MFGFCLLFGWMLFLAESLSSLGVPNLRYISLSQGVHCTFRGVTRLDGARDKKQVLRPHIWNWGLSEANVLYGRKYLWHCWDFSALPAVIWPPFLTHIRRPGYCAPLVPPLCLCVHLLYSRNQLTLRHKIESTWSSIKIQWILVILPSLVVIRNFRDTSSPAELLKGYIVREKLGTPALACGNIFP